MKQGILAARDQVAQERMVTAAKQIAQIVALPEPAFARSGSREQSMLQREQLADFLEEVAHALAPRGTDSKKKKEVTSEAG